MSPPDIGELAPLPFSEWVQPPAALTRRRWYPWASTGLYATGQLTLTALIALQTVDPLIGIGICLVWLACGLALIASQVLTQRAAEGFDR